MGFRAVKRSGRIRLISKTLDEEKIPYRFEDGRKHNKVIFTVAGTDRTYTYTFPCTCSDHRGPRNAVSDIRRIIHMAK